MIQFYAYESGEDDSSLLAVKAHPRLTPTQVQCESARTELTLAKERNHLQRGMLQRIGD